jgi:hypothetical protein
VLLGGRHGLVGLRLAVLGGGKMRAGGLQVPELRAQVAVQVVQGADHVTVVGLEHVDVGRHATGVRQRRLLLGRQRLRRRRRRAEAQARCRGGEDEQGAGGPRVRTCRSQVALPSSADVDTGM